VAVTVLFILATMGVAAAAARMSMAWATETLGMVLGLGLWYVVAGIGAEDSPIRLFTVPAADVIFLIACVLGGRLLSRIIGERNMLLPVALVLALADLFTVFLGPVGAVLANAPDVVTGLSIKVPEVGSAVGPEGAAGLTHLATMGPGDLVFAALFFTAVVRFGLSLRASFAGILIPVVIGLVAFILLPVLPGVPVLPLMAIGFLIATRGQFDLSSEEKRNLAIAGAFLVVVFVVMWLITRALLPEAAEGEQAGQTAAVYLGGLTSARL